MNDATNPEHTFEVGDQVDGGTPGAEDYDLGEVRSIDADGIHITIAWSGGHSTIERWDRDDIQYVPCCARCNRQSYAIQGTTQICTHCGLER